MGTHPIFESDFDCLTDLRTFRDSLKHVGHWSTCRRRPCCCCSTWFVHRRICSSGCFEAWCLQRWAQPLVSTRLFAHLKDATPSSAYWRKTATKQTTCVLSKLSASNIKSPCSKSEIIRLWASGLDCAKSTAKETPERWLAARASSFDRLRTARRGISSRLSSRTTE